MVERRWEPAAEIARPEIQGAILADLTAIWLAGYVHVDDPELTAKLRESLLDLHIAAVCELLPINSRARIDGRRDAARHASPENSAALARN